MILQLLFDPERLKTLLDWTLQVAVVRDLENAAEASPGASSTQIPPVLAAFYLFQCYMHEFGVAFDPEKACHWICQAAISKNECQENYLAQAW